MIILGKEVPEHIIEVYTLWLAYMDLQECEKTLIMFLQDVFKGKDYGWALNEIPSIFTKDSKTGAVAIEEPKIGYGRYLDDINLQNIKQQLKEYDKSSRTNISMVSSS